MKVCVQHFVGVLLHYCKYSKSLFTPVCHGLSFQCALIVTSTKKMVNNKINIFFVKGKQFLLKALFSLHSDFWGITLLKLIKKLHFAILFFPLPQTIPIHLLSLCSLILFKTIHPPVSIHSQNSLHCPDSCEPDSYRQPYHWFLSRGRTIDQSKLQYHHHHLFFFTIVISIFYRQNSVYLSFMNDGIGWLVIREGASTLKLFIFYSIWYFSHTLWCVGPSMYISVSEMIFLLNTFFNSV